MNKFIELVPYAILVKNAIPNPDKVIETVLERNNGVPWNDGYDHSMPGFDGCIIEDTVDERMFPNDDFANLYIAMKDLFVDYINYFNIESQMFKPLYTGNYSIKEYPTGADLGIHRDYGVFSSFNREMPCSITINAYLNDDYVGGELNFYDNDLNQFDDPYEEGRTPPGPILSHKPEAGDAIIFPSIFLHSVSKVTEGTRYGINIRLKESEAPQWWHQIVSVDYL